MRHIRNTRRRKRAVVELRIKEKTLYPFQGALYVTRIFMSLGATCGNVNPSFLNQLEKLTHLFSISEKLVVISI